MLKRKCLNSFDILRKPDIQHFVRGSLHVSLFYWTADVLAFLLLGVRGIINSKKREKKKGAFLCQ